MITVYWADTTEKYQEYYQIFNQYLATYPEEAEVYVWSSEQETIDLYFSETSLFNLSGSSEDFLQQISPQAFVILFCFPQKYSILSIDKQELGTKIVQSLNSEVAQKEISDTSYLFRVLSDTTQSDYDKNNAHQLLARNAILQIRETPLEKQTDIYLHFLTATNCIAVAAGLEPGQTLALSKELIINTIISNIENIYENS